jgi:hypothetical protein
MKSSTLAPSSREQRWCLYKIFLQEVQEILHQITLLVTVSVQETWVTVLKLQSLAVLDGREFSFISVANSFPSNTNPTSASKNLFDKQGKPVSPFTFNMDWGGYFLRYSDKRLCMLRQNLQVKPVRTPYLGASGSNALPISFEQTVFPDLDLHR